MRIKNITLGAIISSLALIGPGCISEEKKAKINAYSFAEIPIEGSLAMTSGDFDGDGDLDLIVGGDYQGMKDCSLFYFENDGKGNFKMRPSAPLESYNNLK